MTECIFCGIQIPPGTGMLFVKNDGKLFHFCSKKCEKNKMKLGRKPSNMKWVKKPASE